MAESSLHVSIVKTAPRVLLMFLNVKKLECENAIVFIFFFLTFFLPPNITWIVHCVCDCSTIEDVTFWIRAPCNLWMVSYSSNYALWSGFLSGFCREEGQTSVCRILAGAVWFARGQTMPWWRDKCPPPPERNPGGLFPVCHFVRISSILENCEDLKSTRPIACESEVIQQDVVVINVWVCQEVGVAMYKMFAFSLLFM